jgi:hypothetical protein
MKDELDSGILGMRDMEGTEAVIMAKGKQGEYIGGQGGALEEVLSEHWA